MNRSEQIKVLGVVGSLRGGSHNAKLLQVAESALPGDAELTRWDGLAALPHYDEDLDVAGGDATVESLRAAIASADVLLLVTPEYNGTIPGVLKNAVDWASRPAGDGALKGKPAAVIGASTGQFGGVWAQADLRKALGIAGARVVEAEYAVPKAAEAFEASGGRIQLADGSSLGSLVELLEALVDEGRRNRAARDSSLAAAA